MKNFLKTVTEFSTWFCLCFTAEIVIYAACCLIFRQSAIDTVMVFELLAVAAAVTLLQYVFFSGRVVNKMRYSLRLLLFSIPLVGILSLCAVLFDWFPLDNAGAWLSFLVAFLICLAAVTLAFEIYFRAAGKKYDGLLGQYRAKKGKGA